MNFNHLALVVPEWQICAYTVMYLQAAVNGGYVGKKAYILEFIGWCKPVFLI